MKTGHVDNFVILSLPRSGSTTLARMLNIHGEISCLIEPFHPQRYNGRFYAVATKCSINAAVDGIWRNWNGFKHVWESNGWPFVNAPGLNDKIALGGTHKIILLIRRNFLRRVVSNLISRQTRYWIGNRVDFERRLKATTLAELDSGALRKQICEDTDAVKRCCHGLLLNKDNARILYYEDVFDEHVAPADQFVTFNSILTFIGATHVSPDVFRERFQYYFDASVHRWATPDVYRRIPNIDQIESEVGSYETGWLFK
jgi:hypothetical protein